MKVVVAVKPSGAPVPLSASQVTAQALTQTSAAWAKAKPLAAAPVPANTVYAGVGSTTAILGFFPHVLKVKAGTTVNFVNRSPSEVHNVAFGPAKYLLAFSKKTDLLPAGPGSPNQVTPLYPFGTEPKGAYTYDGKNHGNGFLSTPLTRGLATRAAAACREGDVHGRRDVQVHLLPPRERHGRNGDRHAVRTAW